jgi:putative redox protein
MKSERVRFPGALGAELAARIDRPDAAARAWAVFAHCFTCSKDLKAANWISRALVERGFGVLRFDFTGIGESAGDFADTNFSSNLDDLVAATEFMSARSQPSRVLIGHSLGGAAVLAAAHRVPDAVAVATIAAPSTTAHLERSLLRITPELQDHDQARVRLGGREFTIKRQLLDDLQEHSLEAAVRKLDRALLVMHSPDDDVLSIEHAEKIFAMANQPKSFVALHGADHLLMRERDARYAADVLAVWAGSYLQSSSPATS